MCPNLLGILGRAVPKFWDPSNLDLDVAFLFLNPAATHAFLEIGARALNCKVSVDGATVLLGNFCMRSTFGDFGAFHPC